MLDISLLWPHTYEKQSKEEGFILLMVLVHHGGEGSVDQSGSYHGSQEGERERECLHSFPLIYSTQAPVYGMVPPTFRAGLPP
jgi:hypothetical protein